MRLLHITEACAGGVQRHLQLVLPELEKRGISCALLGFGNRMSPLFRRAGFAADTRLVELQGNRLSVLRRAIPLIRETVEDLQPDVVWLHAFTAGASGRLALRGTRWEHRTVYSPHGFSFLHPQPIVLRCFVRMLERLLAPHTGALACVGPGELSAASGLGFDARRLALCPNGLPPLNFLSREDSRARLGLPQTGVFGVFPARMEPQKGIMTLLKALRRLRTPRFTLLCYGEGSRKAEAIAFAERNGLSGAVEFRPEREALWECFRAFDFLVMPSFYEGSSYALLEAQAAGIPVITSRIPGAPEQAILTPPGDDRALALALARPETLSKPECPPDLPALNRQIDAIIPLCNSLCKENRP